MIIIKYTGIKYLAIDQKDTNKTLQLRPHPKFIDLGLSYPNSSMCIYLNREEVTAVRDALTLALETME